MITWSMDTECFTFMHWLECEAVFIVAFALCLDHVYVCLSHTLRREIIHNSTGRASLAKHGTISLTNRPFPGSSHMVRNKLYWDANNAVGLPKQRNSYQSRPTFLCFESPTASFASQHNLFHTMWWDPAKGLLMQTLGYFNYQGWLRPAICRITICKGNGEP